METKPKHVVAVDLDFTLCETDLNLPADARRYISAKPIQKMITFVNELYLAGHTIVIYTARGQLSCKGDLAKIEEKYRGVTEQWLFDKGVMYHELRFGKMYYDYLIDDRAWNVNAIGELQHLIDPKPLPLHKTPWYLKLIGYKPWRMYKANMTWEYVSREDFA